VTSVTVLKLQSDAQMAACAARGVLTKVMPYWAWPREEAIRHCYVITPEALRYGPRG
jgi:hypothetical protein